MVKDTYSFISPDKSPAEVIDSIRRFYGPTMNAFEAAQKNGEVEGNFAANYWNSQRPRTRPRTAAPRYPRPSCE